VSRVVNATLKKYRRYHYLRGVMVWDPGKCRPAKGNAAR